MQSTCLRITWKKIAPIRKSTLLVHNANGSGNPTTVKPYSMTPCLQAGQDWRRKQGMPSNPNAYGPLTDGPDYSFIDGRPTPPGTGKIKRAVEQREIASKIIELSKEIDYAVEHHQRKLKEDKDRKAEILGRKLKPKGTAPVES